MSMKVGFIGIGAMGWPMSVNILKGGHDLTVFDTDRDRASRFANEIGGRAAANLADVADNEVVVTMLPTSAVVRQALMDDQGGAGRVGVEHHQVVAALDQIGAHGPAHGADADETDLH